MIQRVLVTYNNGQSLLQPQRPRYDLKHRQFGETLPVPLATKGKLEKIPSSPTIGPLTLVCKSDTSSSTTRETLKRKNQTIRLHLPPAQGLEQTIPIAPKDATLDIGIPCIISSRQKCFRAFACNIGEVEGGCGPWVGVEVLVDEEWADKQLEGRQWNYRVSRRQRTEWVNSHEGSKREGDPLTFNRKKRSKPANPSISNVSSSEYRGLFKRLQQRRMRQRVLAQEYSF